MKKIIKKLVLTLVIGVYAFVICPQVQNNVAYAAACSAETTDTTCEKTTSATCPTGYTEQADKVTCQKAATGAVSSETAKTFESTAALLGMIQKVLQYLLWPILMLIGGLLDNSLLFGGGMEERLREIWVLIRNLVNILFVVILVGIAIYNVLGLEDENYGLKAILPKIIIGIIAVNFSFLAAKVILDGVNVVTTSIFTIPNQVSTGLADIGKDEDTIKRMCLGIQNKLSISDYNLLGNEKVKALSKDSLNVLVGNKVFKGQNFQKTIDVENFLISATTEQNEIFSRELEAAKSGRICTDDAKLTAPGEAFLASYSNRNAALAMVLSLSNMMYTEDLDISVNNIEKLAINSIFAFVVYVVYGAAFIALFIVLMARLVVLWLAIAISPILVMGMTVPVIKEKISAFGDLEEKIVGTTIAPIGIALSMTVGWIMIKALQDVNTLSGSISLVGSTGLPVKGLNSLQDVIVTSATIAVVWLGVFGAASKSIAAGVTDMVKGAVQSAGTWVATLPLKHLPLVPIHIPGAAPGQDSYTASLGEVKYAMNNANSLGSRAHQDELINRIARSKLPNEKSIHDSTKVIDAKGVYSYLNTMGKDKLATTDVQAEIKKFKETSPIYKTIDHDVRKKIENYLNTDPTSKEGKDAITALLGDSKVQREPRLEGEKLPSATAPKPPKVAFDKTKVDGASSRLFTDREKQRQFSDNIQKLGEKINSNNKEETSKIVEAIKKDGEGAITKQAFKDSMGDAGYKELLKNLGDGDEAKGETELDKLLTASAAATPPEPRATNLNTAPEFEQKNQEIAQAAEPQNAQTPVAPEAVKPQEPNSEEPKETA